MFACVVCAALDDVSRTSCMILKQLEVMLPKIRTQSVVAYTDAPAHQTSNTSFDKHQSEHIFYHSLSLEEEGVHYFCGGICNDARLVER